MNPDQQQLAATIHDHIVFSFFPDEEEETIAYDTDLLATGILDSLAAVEMACFLEQVAGARIPSRDLNTHTLRSIATMAAYVAGLRGAERQ
ncbi:MAG TPA: acyl carrier protein [Longimicrobiaceae bacterium]|nr:acyl carrier protein [Longimicrobiaceae bacterium]